MLSARYVRELFDYNLETGDLIWRQQKARRNKIGTVAGVKNPRCIAVMIDYKNHKAHRLIWCHYYGEWPSEEIDHVDGDPHNNRIDNLRLATRKQNSQNVAMHKDNVTGYKGVSRNRNKFVARISGKRLGQYNTAEEASEVYETEAKRLYNEFMREQR